MKRAYALIAVVVAMTFGLFGILFLINIVKNSYMYVNSLDSVQADYIAESAIEVYTSDFYEDLKEIYFKRQLGTGEKRKNISMEVIGEKVNLSLLIPENKKDVFEIESKLKYKDIETMRYAYGSYINKYYTKGVSVISPRTVDNVEDIEEFRDVLEPQKMNYVELPDEEVFVKKDNGLIFYLLDEDEEIEITRAPSGNLFLRQRGGSLTFLDEISINGIVDVHNIILENSLTIYGIFNLMSDINAFGNYNIKVNGITLNVEQSSENNLIANYEMKYVDTYDVNLKNFIKTELKYTSYQKSGN